MPRNTIGFLTLIAIFGIGLALLSIASKASAANFNHVVEWEIEHRTLGANAVTKITVPLDAPLTSIGTNDYQVTVERFNAWVTDWNGFLSTCDKLVVTVFNDPGVQALDVQGLECAYNYTFTTDAFDVFAISADKNAWPTNYPELPPALRLDSFVSQSQGNEFIVGFNGVQVTATATNETEIVGDHDDNQFIDTADYLAQGACNNQALGIFNQSCWTKDLDYSGFVDIADMLLLLQGFNMAKSPSCADLGAVYAPWAVNCD